MYWIWRPASERSNGICIKDTQCEEHSYGRTLTILCSGQMTTTWRSRERKPRKWSSVLKKIPPFIPTLKINVLDIDRVIISKLLGIYVSSDFKCGTHVDKIHAKAFKRLYFLTCMKRAGVEENVLLDYYRSIIRSVVEYACPAWSTGYNQRAIWFIGTNSETCHVNYSSSLAIQRSHHKV